MCRPGRGQEEEEERADREAGGKRREELEERAAGGKRAESAGRLRWNRNIRDGKGLEGREGPSTRGGNMGSE